MCNDSMKHKTAMALAAAAMAVSACSQTAKVAQPEMSKAPARVVGQAAHRPMAVVYRTSGDYGNLVPVTLDATGTRIVSYPDPADLRGNAVSPLPLRDGYLLDRRGIGPRTAYLDITIDEYSRISSAPAPAELLRRIAVRSPFAEMYSLPITAAEAVRDTAACNAYIAGGFDGCKNLLGGKPAPRAITVGGARVE